MNDWHTEFAELRAEMAAARLNLLAPRDTRPGGRPARQPVHATAEPLPAWPVTPPRDPRRPASPR